MLLLLTLTIYKFIPEHLMFLPMGFYFVLERFKYISRTSYVCPDDLETELQQLAYEWAMDLSDDSEYLRLQLLLPVLLFLQLLERIPRQERPIHVWKEQLKHSYTKRPYIWVVFDFAALHYVWICVSVRSLYNSSCWLSCLRKPEVAKGQPQFNFLFVSELYQNVCGLHIAVDNASFMNRLQSF